MSLLFPYCIDLYHLRQGLHVIAASWDYHEGTESRVSVCGNSVRFILSGGGIKVTKGAWRVPKWRAFVASQVVLLGETW
jgi:hypothetical protein